MYYDSDQFQYVSRVILKMFHSPVPQLQAHVSGCPGVSSQFHLCSFYEAITNQYQCSCDNRMGAELWSNPVINKIDTNSRHYFWMVFVRCTPDPFCLDTHPGFVVPPALLLLLILITNIIKFTQLQKEVKKKPAALCFPTCCPWKQAHKRPPPKKTNCSAYLKRAAILPVDLLLFTLPSLIFQPRCRQFIITTKKTTSDRALNPL